MNTQPKKPKPDEMVVLTGLPTGFLDDLPEEDKLAISGVVGKAIILNGYDEDGRAELEFTEENGTIHFIYVNPAFLKSAK
jgi:hypothetical protein